MAEERASSTQINTQVNTQVNADAMNPRPAATSLNPGLRGAETEINLPSQEQGAADFTQINDLLRSCDQNCIPVATNVATAEVLIQGLARGDLAWREIDPKATF